MMKAISFFITLLLVANGNAYRHFQEKIPNGDRVPNPCKEGEIWPGVGHENMMGSGPRNVFGLDFAKKTWQDVCNLDSDGDGKTNGEELGDPSCVWTMGQTPQFVTGLSHPGFCDGPVKDNCVGLRCEEKKSFQETCDVIKNDDVKSIDYRFKQTKVPNTETNYFCQYYNLPQDSDYHIVANEALVDNIDVVHHMIIYACPDDLKDFPGMDTPGPCSMSEQNGCSSPISLWTVGIDGSCFGETLGFKIGKNGYKKIRLEIHYNNPQLVPDYMDQSGIRIFYQPLKPNVADLATFSIGQQHLDIPPGKRSVEFEGSCSSDCTRTIIKEPIYVISTISHMHYLGIMQRTEVIRNGRVIKVLAHDDPYDYNAPIVHKEKEPFQILPGDEVKTVCRFNSMSRKEYVYQGDATNDEMCYAFLTVYPAQAIPTIKWCVQYGPLGICELQQGKPKYDCDWRYFTNISNPEILKAYVALEKYCRLDGECRPRCKAVVDELLKHPCMGKEMNKLVSNFLSTYNEGVRMLGYVRSCQQASHDHGTCSREQCYQHCGDGDDGRVWASGAESALPALTVMLTSAAITMATLLF